MVRVESPERKKLDKTTKFEFKLPRRNIPSEDIVDDIKRRALEIGAKPITSKRYSERGSFGAHIVLRKFGSWNIALETAGIDIRFNANIPTDELFETLASVLQHLGRQPFGREMEKGGGLSKYSFGTYEN